MATNPVTTLWNRFMAWRGRSGAKPFVEEKVPNKVAADEGDIIREKYSNRGGGWGSSF